MTLPEFLDAIEALDVEWYLTDNGHIRTKNTHYCPIVAKVTDFLDTPVGLRNSAAFQYGRHYLKLDNADLYRIVSAADNDCYGLVIQEVRKELLKRTVERS